MSIKKLSLEKIIFLGCLTVFCLLLFKDVFSQRTLIPNFEPFPDTFHYIVPARNLVLGEGFSISREGRSLTSQVGFLYSIFLIPFYSINTDARMFYFANILLSLFGFVIFYKILKKICLNLWINGTSLFLFVTNYYLYWFPSLAMAENLLMFIFIYGAYLLLLPVNYKNIILATLVAISFYLIKYASAPFTFIYLAIYIFKIQHFSKSRKYLSIYLILGFLFLSFSGLYLNFVKNMSLTGAFIYYLSIFSSLKIEGIFSLGYIPVNLPLYINAFIGGYTKVLWDSTPLLPAIVAIIGIVGLVLGSIKSNVRFFCLCLLCLFVASVFFMSTFYSFDSRYILCVIFILLIGFNISLDLLLKFLANKGLNKIFYVILLIFISWYLLSNGLRLKNQIMLNVKHAETPWYYVSILEMNKYFTSDKIQGNKKPILISAMAPYLIDFFSNNNFTLLPLSYDQEFRSAKELVWGPNDYSNLPKLYTKYIKEGYPVYIDRYGLGNETYTNRDFKVIENSFNLTKVQTGCFEQCNIYKLKLKE